MEASGRFGMRVHQAVSFCRGLMHVPRTDAVFFPGCALLSYDPALLQRLLELLRRIEPDIALAVGCCGQPTKYLEPALFAKRTEKMHNSFVVNGVRRIYTACPNCANLLADMHCGSVIPVWETLNQIITPQDVPNHHGESYVLHDPCPVRRDRTQQDAVRSLLKKAGVKVVECARSRDKTVCCGNIAMLRAADPKKSAAMRAERLHEIPAHLPVASYCAGCVDAFASEGCDSAHLVELLVKKSSARGWRNRIANTILSRKNGSQHAGYARKKKNRPGV